MLDTHSSFTVPITLLDESVVFLQNTKFVLTLPSPVMSSFSSSISHSQKNSVCEKVSSVAIVVYFQWVTPRLFKASSFSKGPFLTSSCPSVCERDETVCSKPSLSLCIAFLRSCNHKRPHVHKVLNSVLFLLPPVLSLTSLLIC